MASERTRPLRARRGKVGAVLGTVLALLLGVAALVGGHADGAPSLSHRHDAVAVAAVHALLHPSSGAPDRTGTGGAWRSSTDQAPPSPARALDVEPATTQPHQAPVGRASRDRSPPAQP